MDVSYIYNTQSHQQIRFGTDACDICISQPTQSEGTCKSTSIFFTWYCCIPLLVLHHLQRSHLRRNHLRLLWGLGTFLLVFPTAND